MYNILGTRASRTSLSSQKDPGNKWQLTLWCGGDEYLITMDTNSNFIEVDHLTNVRCSNREPSDPFCKVVYNNATPFTSYHFKNFAKEWMFQHETISPGNSQSNGAAEETVNVVKRLWRKYRASAEDPLIELLHLRNSPKEGLNTSPVQRLFGRINKTLLPATESKLRPLYSYTADEAANKGKRNRRYQGSAMNFKTYRWLK